MGHFAQIPRFLAAGKVPLAKHIPRDPATKDAPSSPSAPTPTGDPAAEEWSPWSVCSTTCGEGWQTRTRFCVSSSYSTQCSGPLREQRQCNNSAVCPGGLSAPCTHGQEGKRGSWNTKSSGHLLHDIFLEGGYFFPLSFPFNTYSLTKRSLIDQALLEGHLLCTVQTIPCYLNAMSKIYLKGLYPWGVFPSMRQTGKEQ